MANGGHHGLRLRLNPLEGSKWIGNRLGKEKSGILNNRKEILMATKYYSSSFFA